MDVAQIKLVIFDVGQTLLFLTTSSEEVLLARCQQLAVDVELEDLKWGRKAGELCVAFTVGLISSWTWRVSPLTAVICSTHDNTFPVPAVGGVDIRGAVTQCETASPLW